jgi:diguanylate cyclase (GGDEF)-like protein
MTASAERSLPTWDFGLPIAQRPRALWARAQQSLKRFVFGAPEDALLAAAFTDRTRTHVAAFALLTLPLFFVWIPGGAIGRWTILLSLISGLGIATRLDSIQHPRANPLGVLAVSAFYAAALSGVAWELLGPHALRVSPGHFLAAFAVGMAVLAARGDPRLCALAGIVGSLSLAALHASGTERGSLAAAAPSLLAGCAASVAATLAALRGQRLQRVAILDTASGALHAAAFERCLAAAQQQASAATEPLMVAKIEFTALPAIRGTHGVAFADALLRWLASALADRFRATDLIGRSGDDEFSIALRGADHPGVERRLERLRDELDTIELRRDGLREPITLRVSFGLAAFPREAEDTARAHQLAAQRLAFAKWRARQAG